MPLTGKVGEQTRFVRVLQTEEKGSDVNLASHMLREGFRGNYEMAVLVTNDSDLLEPIRIVREDLGLVVGILNPHKRASNLLRRQASFMKPIRTGVVRASQFPAEIHDQQGVIRRPAQW